MSHEFRVWLFFSREPPYKLPVVLFSLIESDNQILHISGAESSFTLKLSALLNLFSLRCLKHYFLDHGFFSFGAIVIIFHLKLAAIPVNFVLEILRLMVLSVCISFRCLVFVDLSLRCLPWVYLSFGYIIIVFALEYNLFGHNFDFVIAARTSFLARCVPVSKLYLRLNNLILGYDLDLSPHIHIIFGLRASLDDRYWVQQLV